jgi:hypothetical protein
MDFVLSIISASISLSNFLPFSGFLVKNYRGVKKCDI